jgi:hypothetical protein
MDLSRMTETERKVGVVFLVVMALAVLIWFRPAGETRPSLLAGDNARLNTDVVAATTEAGHRRVVQLLLADDKRGLAGMVLARQAALLDRGTKVRILGGVSPVEVRVMDGRADGLAVFVARKVLEPAD